MPRTKSFLLGIALGVAPLHAADQVVTNTDDSGPGSLRQAIFDVVDGDTITFLSALSGDTITLGGSALTLSKNLTINASDLPEGLILSGNGSSRVFEVSGDATVVLESLTISAGQAPHGSRGTNGGIGQNGGAGSPGSPGGGILNSGDLTLRRCTLSGNRAGRGGDGGSAGLGGAFDGAGGAGGSGGAISNSGTLTIEQCTLAENSSGSAGSGFFSASISGAGAGIENSGQLAVTYSTISGNSIAPGGLVPATGGGISTTGATTINGSIISGNTPDDLNGTLSAASGENLIDGDPLLHPLGDFGGPTPTMLPQSGSPVIDAGGSTALATDQRGRRRLAGEAVDIGAVERSIVPLVTTISDLGPGSLRDAIATVESEAIPEATITFDPSLAGQTISLGGGELVIDRSLNIDASVLASPLTIDASSASPGHRVLQVNAGATVVLQNLVISGGNIEAPTDGGGIYNEGDLTLDTVTVRDNSTLGNGGGISTETGSLTVIDSTISGNSANYGGGILASRGAMLSVTQSTIASNTADESGGGIYLDASPPTVLVQSTISGNRSDSVGGGIYSDMSPRETIRGCIVAGNSTGNEVGQNVFPDSSNAVESYVSSDGPLLSPLGNYGGPTETMPPLPDSPVIDEIFGNQSLLTDQRGLARQMGFATDYGAVEYQGYPDLLATWASDGDGDGNPFGIERGIGTDPELSDPGDPDNLRIGADRRLRFSTAPTLFGRVAWLVTRSTDLRSFPRIVYGPSVTPPSSPFADPSPPASDTVFYRLQTIPLIDPPDAFNEQVPCYWGDTDGGDDYFLVRGNPAGDEFTTLTAELEFDHALGDINLQILDPDGNVLTSSATTTDNETATQELERFAHVFVRVFQVGSSGNTYCLKLSK